MKLEALMLRTLFAAALLLCLGVISAMMILPAPATLATAHAPAAATAGSEG